MLFVSCLTRFLLYANERNLEITLGEGRIKNPRRTRAGDKVEDGEHMKGSLHYSGLAIDLNLFVDGKYITRTEHPVWQELGKYWESLHPLCRWGGRFHDGNHLSVTFGGRA